MKKSGNLLWFALFGIMAQTFFLGINHFFFGFQVVNKFVLFSSLVTIWCFIALRIMMDWEVSDSIVEDKLRETFISQAPVKRFIFACIGGAVLFFGNPLTNAMGLKALVSGMLVVNVTQSFMETLRIELNNIRKMLLEKNVRGVNAWITENIL